MASYARNQAAPNKNHQMPAILAQAKPAIISSQHNVAYRHQQQQNQNITGILSEKINTALKFSPTAQQREMAKINFDQKLRHIEDDCVIQKQNASNQMRQAAVMAAVASQQKVRLSATERLALTAKRPMTNQQSNQQQPKQEHPQEQQLVTGNCNAPPVSNFSKPTPLPTLETLLAVQRQLQQHTKQHLNSVPQQMVNYNNNNNSSITNKQVSVEPVSSSISTTTTTSTITKSFAQQRNNKPLPPSPPKSPSPQLMKQALAKAHANYAAGYDTYDKDLPPLPPSISPSTSTDDSQLNSLESHQSSPANSLVSLPPPPPPISSYLEQYDEVNSCLQSNSSTPSITSSSVSEISSLKQFILPMQMKTVSASSSLSSNSTSQPSNSQTASFELPLPYANQSQSNYEIQNCPPTLAPKPPPVMQQPNAIQRSSAYATNQQQRQKQQQQYHQGSYEVQVVKQFNSNDFKSVQQQMKPEGQCTSDSSMIATARPLITQSPEKDQNENQDHLASPYNSGAVYKPQINYQQHMFTMPQAPSGVPFMPPPPPPLTSGLDKNEGFDEPDSGSFRFPTPPPPDLLLEDEDDDDFECKIPTPPLYKSMSAATFAEFQCKSQHLQPKQQTSLPQQQQQQNQSTSTSTSSIFNSSTFSVSTAANSVQPPPPFRQQQQQPPTIHYQQQASTAPQLTVHINNEGGGLLSTANSNANHHHHHHHHHHHQAANHHHHIMMSMAASSSSPSSSSDGDGHSSNSSSSTSGIHSSIDSPSSSNSKLDDFNYSSSMNGTGKLSSKRHTSNHHHKGNSITTALPQTSTVTAIVIRPALKQKKTVSFSDKVELVACAGEQSEDHLPNPLLARVLAGKLQ